ncbi:MAG: hypothetical protein JJU29_08680 [Verrucomicrobia bacterium]|nr:hypothetical protein [Verrucomicrobiota bacterium]MCH8511239.1 hypothetical protein [Kiritimatiellia bacterium]
MFQFFLGGPPESGRVRALIRIHTPGFPLMKHIVRILSPILLIGFVGPLAASANLLGVSTDDFPGGYRVDFVNGRAESTGRIPTPWSAVFTEDRGEGRLVFGPDPVRERPAFGLLNLTGPRGLALVTNPPISLRQGTEYRLQVEVLTTGNAQGTLRMSGAARRVVPLRNTRGTWQRLTETFVAETDSLELRFSSAARGAENGIYLSRMELEAIGEEPEADEESVGRARGAALQGVYGNYQRDFSNIGRLSFLNGPDADVLMRGVEQGTLREAENMPFSVYRRFEVERAGTSPQAVRLSVTNRDNVHPGETLMLVFYARGFKTPQAVDDGEGAEIQALIRGPDDVPGNQSLKWHWNEPNRTQMLRERWTRHTVHARWPAHRELNPNEVRFEIHMAKKAQTIDIGGMALISVADADTARFPRPVHLYVGQAEDAAWREEAAQRIETHRKGDLTLRVTDAEGNPVPEARVHLEMQRHQFQFGTALSLLTWHGRTRFQHQFTQEDMENYRSTSMAYFNRVNVEDAFTWSAWESAKNSDAFTAMVEEMITYYRERRVAVEAGPFWTPGAQHVPASAREDLPGSLRKSIEERLERGGNNISDWVVIRETAGNRDLLREDGPEIFALGFNHAHATNPEVRLWLEEADIRHAIFEGSFEEFGISANTGWLGWLQGQNAPVHGLKVHAQSGLLRDFGPERWWRILDVVQSRFEVPVRFSRFHVPIRDPEDPDQRAYQEGLFTDSLMTLFAHPAVNGVEMAGFWAPAHPFSSAALWDQAWNQTRLGDIYLDLVFNQWWSNIEGETDENGELVLRVFRGHHQVTIEGPRGSVTRLLDLDGETGTLDVQMP